METVKAFAPATLANFNVGFDIMGLSLGSIGDVVGLDVNGKAKNQIVSIENGPGIPYQVEKNCCSVVIQKMQEKTGEILGVDISITKGFYAGSGLGSSSASSAAAAMAYNQLIGSVFALQELVAFAAEGEKIACGTAHWDNVAPSLFGGLTLIQQKPKMQVLQLPIIPNLQILSILPDVEIKTSDSRAALPSAYPMEDISKQNALTAAVIKSLYTQDLGLFQHSLKDVLVEPYRKKLIPGFQEMNSICSESGCLAFGISGSGPSMFALFKNDFNLEELVSEIGKFYQSKGLESSCYINPWEEGNGARIL